MVPTWLTGCMRCCCNVAAPRMLRSGAVKRIQPRASCSACPGSWTRVGGSTLPASPLRSIRPCWHWRSPCRMPGGWRFASPISPVCWRDWASTTARTPRGMSPAPSPQFCAAVPMRCPECSPTAAACCGGSAPIGRRRWLRPWCRDWPRPRRPRVRPPCRRLRPVTSPPPPSPPLVQPRHLLGVETGGIAPSFSPLSARGGLTRAARAWLAASDVTPEEALTVVLCRRQPPAAKAHRWRIGDA